MPCEDEMRHGYTKDKKEAPLDTIGCNVNQEAFDTWV